MDRPTTPREALTALRILSAAVEHAAEIPDEWRPLLGGARPLADRTEVVNALGKRRRIRTVRTPSPWDSTRDGIPWEFLAEWRQSGPPPLLLASVETNRLGAAALTYALTAEDPALSLVAPHPAALADRPRVVVWGGQALASTPGSTHRQATAAFVAGQVANAVDAYADGLPTATAAAPYRRETRDYRAFSDAAGAAISRTVGWFDEPFIQSLFANHEKWSRNPQTTGNRQAYVPATVYGVAVAGPADKTPRITRA
jgi:hypothetical protein